MTDKHESLFHLSKFIIQFLISIFAGLVCIFLALCLGMMGYHGFEGMPWVDAFVNAAMILSGMGPVTPLHTDGGKIFAGFYALFSGLIFIIIIGITFAPVIQRFYHKMHLRFLEADKK